MATFKENNMQSQPTKSIVLFRRKVSDLFHKKYCLNEDYYGTRLINDIIYNEKCQLVSKFKDYLIWDDDSEFSKRYYTRRESSIRLPKFFDYYENYSKIFPNYTILLESKYIYKNIHKKQKVIDIQQENLSRDSNDLDDLSDEEDNEVFSTEVYNSIFNDNEDIGILFNISESTKENEEKDVNALIDLITTNEKAEPELTSQNFSGNNNTTTHYIGTIDIVNKKKVLSPKTYHNHHDHLFNKMKGKKSNLSLSQLLKQQRNLNKSNHDGSKEHSIGRLRNEKYQSLNSAFNSFHTKNGLSMTLSQHIPQMSIIPLTYRDGNYQSGTSNISKIQISNSNNNHANDENNRKCNHDSTKEQSALSPPKQTMENNIIKVNIRMKDSKPTTHKTLISQIQASNKFYFQSKLIGTQVSKQNKKATEARSQLLSPPITSRKGNNSSNSNHHSNNNEKENNKKNIQNINLFLTDRSPHNPKDIDLMIKQSIQMKLNPKWNNSIRTNNYMNAKKNSVIKKREYGRNTRRTNSNNIMIKQLNYSNNSNNNTNNSQLINKGSFNNQPMMDKRNSENVIKPPLSSSLMAEKSPIKNMMKAIHIKGFGKAILDTPHMKISTERQVTRKRNVLNI